MVCQSCGDYVAQKNDLCLVCHHANFCQGELSKVAHLCLSTRDLAEGLNPSTLEQLVDVVQQFPSASNLLEMHQNKDADISGLSEEVRVLIVRSRQRIWNRICGALRRWETRWVRSFHRKSWQFWQIKNNVRLKRALEQLWVLARTPLCSEFIMVSVLSHYGIDDFHRSLGFTPSSIAEVPPFELEITAGYYSVLRGDTGALMDHISVFSADHSGYFSKALLKHGSLFFGIGAERHEAAHWIGRENEVRNFLIHFVDEPWVAIHLGSVDTDITMALRFWDDKKQVRYVTF